MNSSKSKKIVKIILCVIVFAVVIVGIVCAYIASDNSVCSYCKNQAPAEDNMKFSYFWKEVSSTATCNEGGVIIYACEKCGREYEVHTDALGHDYKVTSDTANCIRSGTKTLVCKRCGDKKTEMSAQNNNHILENSVYKYENGYGDHKE